MNTTTGKIDQLTQLTPKQYIVLSRMNRGQRRKYYKAHRKEFRWPSWTEVNSSLMNNVIGTETESASDGQTP